MDIAYGRHVRIMKTCTQIGTFLTIPTGTSICHECKSCIMDTCGVAQSLAKHSTPWKLGIRSSLKLTSMMSVRQHLKTRRPRSGRPKPYSHWYILAFCGDRPDTDDDIDGACRRRQVPLQLSQKVFDGQSPSRADAAIIQHERFRYAQLLLQGFEFRMNASQKQVATTVFCSTVCALRAFPYERLQFRAPCW